MRGAEIGKCAGEKFVVRFWLSELCNYKPTTLKDNFGWTQATLPATASSPGL